MIDTYKPLTPSTLVPTRAESPQTSLPNSRQALPSAGESATNPAPLINHQTQTRLLQQGDQLSQFIEQRPLTQAELKNLQQQLTQLLQQVPSATRNKQTTVSSPPLNVSPMQTASSTVTVPLIQLRQLQQLLQQPQLWLSLIQLKQQSVLALHDQQLAKLLNSASNPSGHQTHKVQPEIAKQSPALVKLSANSNSLITAKLPQNILSASGDKSNQTLHQLLRTLLPLQLDGKRPLADKLKGIEQQVSRVIQAHSGQASPPTKPLQVLKQLAQELTPANINATNKPAIPAASAATTQASSQNEQLKLLTKLLDVPSSQHLSRADGLQTAIKQWQLSPNHQTVLSTPADRGNSTQPGAQSPSHWLSQAASLLNQIAILDKPTEPSSKPIDLPSQLLALFFKPRAQATSASETKPNKLGPLQQLLATQVTRQLIPHTNAASDSQHWQLELPVRHNEHLHSLWLDIRRDWLKLPSDEEAQHTSADSTNKKRVSRWRIQLDFDLPGLGSIGAQLEYSQQRLRSQLWVERSSTLLLAKIALPTLQQGLRKALKETGVQLEELSLQQGCPPLSSQALQQSLIDLHT